MFLHDEAASTPCLSGRQHRSNSVSATRPVRHSSPSKLSIVARPTPVSLILPGELIPEPMAWLDPGITTCCKSPLRIAGNSDSVAASLCEPGLPDADLSLS